jgi:sterol desaturase/sphingolipid hydroxylase (fatty acid hydroxylase superfamily)
MTLALLAPFVIAGAAVLFMVLERLRPYAPQPLLRKGFWTDLLFYTLLQSYVLALVIAWIVRALDDATGLSRSALVGAWSVGLQVLFFFVTHDLYIYWFHRWQHHSDTLWRLHEAHHSGGAVDWLTASRSHALEILINQTSEFAPLVLLGAAPEVVLWKAMIDAVWGMYIHSNIDVRTGWLQRVVNGPEMHRWHHAIDLAPPGVNFATKLAVWDWLFGTAWLPARKPSGYGLTTAFPDNYAVQQAFAFRRA